MANEKDYHGHPNYLMVLVWLMVLMALTIVVDLVFPADSRGLAVLLIFGMSTVKAYLVISNFMHLKYEPKLVDLFPYLSIACMLAFFFGVLPDTSAIENIITQ